MLASEAGIRASYMVCLEAQLAFSVVPQLETSANVGKLVVAKRVKLWVPVGICIRFPLLPCSLPQTQWLSTVRLHSLAILKVSSLPLGFVGSNQGVS